MSKAIKLRSLRSRLRQPFWGLAFLLSWLSGMLAIGMSHPLSTVYHR